LVMQRRASGQIVLVPYLNKFLGKATITLIINLRIFYL